MATARERLAEIRGENAAPAKSSEIPINKQKHTRYIPGQGFVEMETSDAELMGKRAVGSVAKNIIKAPAHLAADAKSGRIDKMMDMIGMAWSNSGESHNFGVPLPDILPFQAASAEEYAEEGLIAKGSRALLKRTPNIEAAVDNVGAGGDGVPGSNYEKIIGVFAEDEYTEHLMQTWSTADPLEADLWTGVKNLGKLVASQGDSMALSAIPVAGWYALNNLAYEENLERMGQHFEANEIPFDKDSIEYQSIARLYATAGTVAEVSGDLITLGGAAGNSIIKPIMRESASVVYAGAKTLLGVAANTGAEAGTEGWQSFTSDSAVNKALESYAAANGVEVTLISGAEMGKNARGAAATGAWVAGTFNAAGSPKAFGKNLRDEVIREFKAANTPEAIAKNNTELVNRLNTVTTGLAKQSVAKADVELRTYLEAQETGDLIQMLDDIGVTEVAETQDGLVDTLMNYKLKIPEWQKRAMEYTTAALESQKDLSTFEKHAAKWMISNDMNLGQVEQTRLLYDTIAKRNGFTDINEFMDRNMKLDGSSRKDFEEVLTAPGWMREKAQVIEKETQISKGGDTREKQMESFMGHVRKRYSKRDMYEKLKVIDGTGEAWWMTYQDYGQAGSPIVASHEGTHGVLSIDQSLLTLMKWMHDHEAEIETEYKGKSGKEGAHLYWQDAIKFADKFYGYKGWSRSKIDKTGLIHGRVSILNEVVAIMMEPGRVPQENREAGWDLIRTYFGDGMVETLQDPKNQAKTEFSKTFEPKRREAQELEAEIETLFETLGDNYEMPQPTKTRVAARDRASLFGLDPDRVDYVLGDTKGKLKDDKLLPVVEELLAKKKQMADLLADQTIDATSAIRRFYQMGRKLDSGNQVVRGETQIATDGKFILNLFQTGDMTTLAHEFAHITSGYMDDALVRSVVLQTIKEYQNNQTPKKVAQLTAEYEAIWADFRTSPEGKRFADQESYDSERLREMQETMATMFESYLATQTAPTPELRDMLKRFADRYEGYYSDIRGLKRQYQAINPYIAGLFDDYVAGRKSIPRVQDREVTLDDADGNPIVYRLLQSRPQIKDHRTILKHLRKAEAEIIGLQKYLENYTDRMLANINLGYGKDLPGRRDLSNAIKAVGSNKEAIAYIERVDRVIAKAQQSRKGKLLSTIHSIIKENLAKPSARKGHGTGLIVANGIKDPEIRTAFEKLLSDIDPKKRTEIRIRKNVELKKALKGMIADLNLEDIKGLGEADIADLKLMKEDAQFLLDMEKRTLESMSESELRALISSLKNLADYDLARDRQFVDARANDREGKQTQANAEVTASSRFQVRKKKSLDQKAQGKTAEKSAKFLGKALFNPSRALDHIGKVSPVIGGLMEDMRQGVRKKFEKQQEYSEMLSIIASVVPENGVSEMLGFVKDSEKESIVMYDMDEVQPLSQAKPKIPHVKDGETLNVPDHVFDPNFEDRARWQAEYNEDSLKSAAVPVKVTQGEIMMWYGYSKNPHALNRVMTGGVRFKNNPKTLYKFRSEQEFMSAIDTLPDHLKQVVDQTMRFYDSTVRNDINATSTDLVGYGIADVDNYLPIFSEFVQRDKSEMETLNNLRPSTRSYIRERMAHRGFVHMRQESSQPIYSYDFFNGVQRNLNQVAEYVGQVLPIHQMRAVIFGDEGETSWQTLHKSLETMLHPDYLAQVKKWLDRIEDPTMDYGDELASNIMKWANRTKRGILKISPSIAAIQTISILGGPLQGVKMGNIAKVLASRGLEPKYTMQELRYMHPSLWVRFQNVPSIDFGSPDARTGARRMFMEGRDTASEKMKNARGFKETMKSLAALDDTGLMPMKYMDGVALSKLLEAIELEGLSPEATMEKFMNVVEKTQPQNDPVFMSMFYNTTNPLVKSSFGAFQSQRDQYRGEMQATLMDLQDARYDLVRARAAGLGATKKNRKGRLDVKAAKKAYHAQMQKSVGRLVFIGIISSGLVAAIKQVVNGLGDDDDDDGSFGANVALGTVKTSMGFFPLVGDLAVASLDTFSEEGYQPSIGDNVALSSWLSIVVKASNGTKKLAEGDEEGAELLMDAVWRSTTAAGTSLGNLEKWMKKVDKEIED